MLAKTEGADSKWASTRVPPLEMVRGVSSFPEKLSSLATGKAKSNEGRGKKEASKKDFFKFGECLDGEANMKKEVEGRCERKSIYGSLSGTLVNQETFPAKKRAVRMKF